MPWGRWNDLQLGAFCPSLQGLYRAASVDKNLAVTGLQQRRYLRSSLSKPVQDFLEHEDRGPSVEWPSRTGPWRTCDPAAGEPGHTQLRYTYELLYV